MRSLLAAAAAAVVSTTFACSKAPVPARPANQAPGAPKAVDYSAALADPLGFLPMDSELVLGLDWAELRTNPLWKQFEPKVVAAAGQGLVAFKQNCGFDPLASVTGVTMGIKDLGAEKPDGVMVVSGLDRTRLLDCMKRAGQENPSLVAFDGDLVTVTSGDDKFVFAFVDATTAVGMVGPGQSPAAMRAVLGSGVPLRGAATFVELTQRVNFEDTMWLLMNGNSKAFDAMRSSGVNAKFVFGSMALASGLSASFRARLDTPANATNLAQMGQGQLQMAAGFFEKLEITADGADVVVVAKMTQAQLESVAAMLGGMIGSP